MEKIRISEVIKYTETFDGKEYTAFDVLLPYEVNSRIEYLATLDYVSKIKVIHVNWKIEDTGADFIPFCFHKKSMHIIPAEEYCPTTCERTGILIKERNAKWVKGMKRLYHID